MAAIYREKLNIGGIKFCSELADAKANYWLNALLLNDKDEREQFLAFTNDNGVMTRPPWELMHQLPMFQDAPRGILENSECVADRLVNIPSSVRL